MPYSKNEVKSSNVNYVGKDFNDLKKSLINYTKSYFPNTYKDFNETSPGMMLLELSAYVGDVLNFYVDQQYKEMMLPLSEDRRNLITLAKSYGYKTKSITPAYVNLTVKDTVTATADGSPDYGSGIVIDKGMQIASSIDSNLIFETLDMVDFKVSSSADPAPVVSNVNSTTGAPSEHTFTRYVKAISGETKTTTFNVGDPTKFLKLTLPETNVIEILKVVDSNTTVWYEVKTLAQDKIPIEKHYTSDSNRGNAYSNLSGNSTIKTPVPYSLEYIKTGKRFMVEVDENNKTSLVFGNGILKNGNTFDATFLAIEQIGINLPGGEEDLESTIDPLLGDAYGTLGQAPAHLTFTVTYRVGGGITSNIPSGILTNISSITTLPSGGTTSNISVTNDKPAAGGSVGETLEEIRYRTMGHFYTQNRCVTKQDYEARALAMSAKFGNIAKIYSIRAGAVRTAQREKIANLVDRLKEIIDKNYQLFDPGLTADLKVGLLQDIKLLLDADKSGGLNKEDFEMLYETLEMTFSNVSQDDRLYTVDLYLLSYDNNKNLIATPNIIKQNLKQYLNQYRLLTDQVSFYDGYVINFGVIFDVIAQQYENKEDVKVRCIQAIKSYFTADKMQFKQILYINDVNQLLMDVDGVRAVNYTTITQDKDYNAETGEGGSEESVFAPGLYTTLMSSDGTTSTTKNKGYGYYYDFSKFYGKESVAGQGIILPAYEPAVFELKNPNQNIKGIVR